MVHTTRNAHIHVYMQARTNEGLVKVEASISSSVLFVDAGVDPSHNPVEQSSIYCLGHCIPVDPYTEIFMRVLFTLVRARVPCQYSKHSDRCVSRNDQPPVMEQNASVPAHVSQVIDTCYHAVGDVIMI